MKTSRNTVQIRKDDVDVVFEMWYDCSNTKRVVTRKCSTHLSIVTLIRAITLKLKMHFVLMLGKEVVPLLVRRLWVEMVLKALVVPNTGAQVPHPIVRYQTG